MKWFKHDTDATNDPKIRKLKKQFGMEGYGFYFNLLELIARDMEDRPDEFGFLPTDWDYEALEMETGLSSDKLRTITDFMCEIGLFCLKDKRLYNSKIIERCDDYTSRILRNKAQNTKSTNIVRTKSDKVPLDKIRIDKNRDISLSSKITTGDKYQPDFKPPQKMKMGGAYRNKGQEFGAMVIRLAGKFNGHYKDRFKEEYLNGNFSVDPIAHQVSKNRKHMTEQEFEAVIEGYFKSQKSKDLAVTLSACFSDHSILSFKQNKNKQGTWN